MMSRAAFFAAMVLALPLLAETVGVAELTPADLLTVADLPTVLATKDIARVVGTRWTVTNSVPDAALTRVVLQVDFSREGKPTDISLLASDDVSSVGTEAAFSAARRAVLLAYRDGGLHTGLAGKRLVLIFDPVEGTVQ